MPDDKRHTLGSVIRAMRDEAQSDPERVTFSDDDGNVRLVVGDLGDGNFGMEAFAADGASLGSWP